MNVFYVYERNGRTNRLSSEYESTLSFQIHKTLSYTEGSLPGNEQLSPFARFNEMPESDCIVARRSMFIILCSRESQTPEQPTAQGADMPSRRQVDSATTKYSRRILNCESLPHSCGDLTIVVGEMTSLQSAT